MMSKFFLTFGQSSPARNGWVLVMAPDMAAAEKMVRSEYGDGWANLYTPEDFEPDHYPVGQLAIIS